MRKVTGYLLINDISMTDILTFYDLGNSLTNVIYEQPHFLNKNLLFHSINEYHSHGKSLNHEHIYFLSWVTWFWVFSHPPPPTNDLVQSKQYFSCVHYTSLLESTSIAQSTPLLHCLVYLRPTRRRRIRKPTGGGPIWKVVIALSPCQYLMEGTPAMLVKTYMWDITLNSMWMNWRVPVKKTDNSMFSRNKHLESSPAHVGEGHHIQGT